VDGDVLVALLVVDVDDNDVALARIDGRGGKLAVHGEDGLLVAEPGHFGFLDLGKKCVVNSSMMSICSCQSVGPRYRYVAN
jgi:hypothetical protein